MKHTPLTLTALLTLGLAVPAGFAGERPMLTHDWPAYTGPDGTFTVPDQTPILSELKKAKLLWVNEQEDLGYAKTVSSDRGWIPGTRPWPSGSGSLIVAGGQVIAGYFRPVDNVSPTNRATNTNAVAKITGNVPPRIEAKEVDPFAASGTKASAAGDGDEEVSAGKGVAPQVALVADDIVVAVDAATGKTRWKQVYAGKGLNRGAGKHPIYGAVPVASGGKVFHLGTAGLVYAVDLATGKPVWEADVGQFRQDLLAVLKRTEGKPDAERVAEVGKWWPYAMRGQMQVVDGVLLVPFNTRYINNWDLVDPAPKIVGPYLDGGSRALLYRFVRSKNLWERRIAILATSHFIRQYDFTDTLSLSEQLLDDDHDLMHKAVGWMLREVGKKDVSVLERFLRKHYQRMPRTTLRYAIERFAAELLDVRDSLELGIAAWVSAEPARLLEGMEATLRLLNRAFENSGLSVVDPAGQPFNPEFHEAMATQPSADQPAGTVLAVVQKGYLLNGRLLRPARVLVAREADQSAN